MSEKLDENLLAELWEFTGFVPESCDLTAASKEMRVFFSLPELTFDSEAEKNVFIFHSGFYRGAAWMLHKIKSRERGRS